MSKRFEKLRFPVHKHLGEDYEKVFPELFRYKVFRDYGFNYSNPKKKKERQWVIDPKRHPHRDQVIHYLAMLLDPRSDLHEEFDEFSQRQEAAAIESGFERGEDEEWPKFVQDLFDYADDQFVNICMYFLKTFKSPEWTEICTLEVELDRNMRIRMGGIKGKGDEMTAADLEKSHKLRIQCDEIRRQLRSQKDEFVYGDQKLKEKVEEELLTPENAERILSVS